MEKNKVLMQLRYYGNRFADTPRKKRERAQFPRMHTNPEVSKNITCSFVVVHRLLSVYQKQGNSRVERLKMGTTSSQLSKDALSEYQVSIYRHYWLLFHGKLKFISVGKSRLTLNQRLTAKSNKSFRPKKVVLI